jgi:hypothetical protein
MLRKILLLLFASVAAAQTVTSNPSSGVGASLSVFADKGDLTYCILTPIKGTKPAVSLTCRRSGVTRLTMSYIDSTGVVSCGDITWFFEFTNFATPNPPSPQFYFSAYVGFRQADATFLFLSTDQNTGDFQDNEPISGQPIAPEGTPAGPVVVTANVLKWNPPMGIMTDARGQLIDRNLAGLYVNNIVGEFSPFQTIRVTGQTSGATALVGLKSPDTNYIMKSNGYITWPTPVASRRGLLTKIKGVLH